MACQHMQGKGRCCYDFPFFFNLSFIYIMQLLKRAPGLSISTKNIFVATYIRCRVRERKKKNESFPHYTEAYSLLLIKLPQPLQPYGGLGSTLLTHQEQAMLHKRFCRLKLAAVLICIIFPFSGL